MLRRVVLLCVLGLTLLVGCMLPAEPETAWRGGVLNPPKPAPDFALVDQQGRSFHLRAQAGRVTLLFFGYTHCPDVCPLTLSLFRQVHQALGADARRVEFVFVTVDPERDTPERLRHYLAQFDPAIVGLTGRLAELEPVWRDYGVFAEREEALKSAADQPTEMAHTHTAPGVEQPMARATGATGTATLAAESNASGYAMAHSATTYLVDSSGNLRLVYPVGVTAKDVEHDLQQLLKGS